MKSRLVQLFAIALLGVLCGCNRLETRVNPAHIGSDQRAVVIARLDGASGQNAEFKLVRGDECVSFAGGTVATNDRGFASIGITGARDVRDCVAVVEVTLAGKTGRTHVRVNPVSAVSGRLDGVSAIALVLLGSFAIDRFTRALLFLLGFSKRWRSKLAAPGRVAADGRSRWWHLLYYAIAIVLSLIVIAWWGKVRLLNSLGFYGTNEYLDSVVTALILVAAADRIEAVMGKLGLGGDVAMSGPAPVQVSGTLTLVDPQREDKPPPR